MKTSMWMPAIIILLIYAAIAIVFLSLQQRKLKQLQQYWNIKIGMSEAEMLQIMGNGYNRSLLKNDRIKYEWRINASSSGYTHKGYSTRHYSGVKKVAIYVHSGYVEEVRPYNV